MLWARCVCSQVCSDSTGVCNALIEPNVAPNHGGTASGSKQSGFGFPVLLRPALVTFNSLQLDWDKIEGFNEGWACSAFNVCCKCYPTSSQVRITASDQTLRGYKTTPGAGGEPPFFVGLLILDPVISQWTQPQSWKCLSLISRVLYTDPVHFDQLCHSTSQAAFLSSAEMHY